MAGAKATSELKSKKISVELFSGDESVRGARDAYPRHASDGPQRPSTPSNGLASNAPRLNSIDPVDFFPAADSPQ